VIRTVADATAEFSRVVGNLVGRGGDDLSAVEATVRSILDEVRAGGDTAVLSISERLDGRRPARLFTRDYDGQRALERLPADLRRSLELSAARIIRYHEHQKLSGFRYEEDGIRLGMRVRPVQRAGVYAPGGKARYPSSVLMSAIPARVAGVPEILLATIAPDDVILAAAYLSGVTGVLDAGGAQAIGALAYGTESVPKVDKIVGPGNRYVACAKRLVFGEVGIDSLAGPSEILVLCDASARPAWVAADLLSQAEHDEDAYALCITTDAKLAEPIARELDQQLAQLPRRAIASASVEKNGVILVVPSRDRMVELADAIAAEHVAIHAEDPDDLFDRIGAIGAAFVGPLTPEAAGDYVAGPSHVLPTGGCVRHSSPLGVYDFVARSSYIRYEAAALAVHAQAITTLARAEGLEAHARAVEMRTSKT
jgi:histidinol dehydrogenase